MNIALFGATGMVGSAILAEALARGHQVTAIVRRPERIAPNPAVRALAGDATDAASVAATVAGADVVVSAYSPGSGNQDELSANAAALLAGLAQAEVRRLIVVGGAGSLETNGGLLVDQPGFPEMYRDRANAQKRQLDLLRGAVHTPVRWTFVSPAAMIAPGERTGVFRVGGDQLMVDATGASRISAEDFAIAILDEVERPGAPNRRISVAY
jgi:putative NADH-flavin reductase